MELYIQVTTISWLSVRSVQRSSQSQQTAVSGQETSLNIFSYLPSWSELVGEAGAWREEREELVETRADERIRRAQELEANNSKARAKLALNQIWRSITIKKLSNFNYL